MTNSDLLPSLPLCMPSLCDRLRAYPAMQCWCGEDGIDFDRHGTATCDFPCAGDSSETCGGYFAFSLCSTPTPEPTPVPTPVPTQDGDCVCYQDSRTDRVMTNMLTSNDMTNEVRHVC